jgi:hypothetical protein
MRSRADEEKPKGRALSNFAVRIRYGFLRLRLRYGPEMCMTLDGDTKALEAG